MKRKTLSFMIRIAIISSFLVQSLAPLGAFASQDISLLEHAPPSLLEQSEPTQTDTNTGGVEQTVEANGQSENDGKQLFLPLVEVDNQDVAGTSTESAEDEAQLDETVSDVVDTDQADETNIDETNAPEIQAAADNSDTSPYGLGGQMSASGAILPSITNFSSDLFSGSANINIPIEAPSGLGGMNPNISLSYSSASVNAIRSSAGPNEHNIQAGLPGYGWSIGGLSYIVVGARQTSMVLNGTSVRIDKDGNTSPHIFAKVQQNVVQDEDSDYYDPLEQNRGEWIVTTTDGTKYIFGSPPEQQIFTLNTDVEKLAIETLIDWDNKSNRTRRKVVKYLLREVIDPSGNRMEYEYEAETGAVGGCVEEGSSGRWASQKWYHRTTLPTKITWSANGEDDTGKMSMLFEYESRTDINSSGGDSWIDDGDCNQHQHSKKKLKDITVNVTVGTTEHTLSKYVLEQSYYPNTGNEKHLQLNAVKKYGKGGTGSELFSQGFVYSTKHTSRTGGQNTEDGLNGLRLTTATHSWGGSTEYIYKEVPTRQCTRRKSHSNWNSCTRSDDDPAQLVNLLYRYLVTQKNVSDGVTDGSVSKTYYGYSGGLERNDVVGGLESLGHSKVTVTVKDADNAEMKYEVHEFNQRTPGQSNRAAIQTPHPALGKPSRVTLYQAPTLATSNGVCPAGTLVGSRCEMSKTENVWETKKPTDDSPFWGAAAVYADHPRWVRLKESKVTQGGVNNETKYFYESSRQNNTQFGNVTKTEEYADGVRQRVSYTLYYPNNDPTNDTYIVNKPARMRVYAGDNSTCLSETRNIYDSTGNTYKHKSTTGLVYRTETLLNGNCTPTEAIGTYDPNWAISHFDYDEYGNQTVVTHVGPNSSGNQNLKTETTYDSVYNLFPIETKNVRETTFVETAEFYGVNRSINSNGAYWGAMAEFCGVNNICTRQKYDDFGRATYRWDSVPEADGWASDSNANVKYSYHAPDTDDDNDDTDDDNGDGLSGLQTYMATEWHSPRCYGNFVRRHYNGLGQLIHEQSPKQDWRTNVDGCSPGQNKPEVDVDYGYDALGNQIYAGVPRTASGDKASPSRRIAEDGWSTAIKTTSSYDALGRPTKVIAPNGERTEFAYSGRETKVVAKDAAGTADTAKMVKWTETDGLGNLRNVHTGKKSNGRWVSDAQVTLLHNAVGNLESMTNAAGGTATMEYNKAGQKLTMTDPDLGNWSYAYDRLGRLTRQTDACGNKTTLSYDKTKGVLTGKNFVKGSCSGTPAVPYNVTYGYGPSGTEQGQLTLVKYSDNSYQKDFAYNPKGFLSSETVKIAGGDVAGYTTSYAYDGFNRPLTTTYPDNEVLTHNYNSMGLPAKLKSSVSGDLVDGTTNVSAVTNAVNYDEAGRLTAMRYTAGSLLWRTQSYYGWRDAEGNGNGRLSGIKVSTAGINGIYGSSGNRLSLGYAYDVFGNLRALSEGYNNGRATDYKFTYDHINRLTKAFDKSYIYDTAGRLTHYEGSGQTKNGTFPLHSIKNSGYTYDANGNMKTRPGQTLIWNVENRLHSVAGETYLYDENGIRIRKENSSSITLYVGSHFEVEIDNSSGAVVAASLTLQNAADSAASGQSESVEGSPIALDDASAEVEPPADEVAASQPAHIFENEMYLPFVSDSTGIEFDSQEELPFTDIDQEQALNTNASTESAAPTANETDSESTIDTPEELDWIDESFDLTLPEDTAAGEKMVQAAAYMPNPGFESSGSWQETRSWAGTAFHRSTWGIGQERTGSYGHSISNLAYGSLQSEDISVSSGQKFNVYAHARGEVDTDDSQGGWSLRAYFYNGSNTKVVKSVNLHQSYETPGSWKRVGGSVTVPNGVTRMKVILLVHMVSGWVAWDDIEVKKNGSSINLLSNPGFEQGGVWTEARINAFPGTSFYRSGWGTAAEKSGSKAYVISNHAYGILRSPYIAVSQNTQYDLYAHVRGEIDTDDSQGNWLVRVHYYRSNNARIKLENAAVGPAITTSWAKKGKRITTPSGTVKIRIELFNYMNTGWVAFDDVSLNKVGTSANLVPNPGFESSGSWETIRSFPGTSFLRSKSGIADQHTGQYAYAISNQAYGRLESNPIPVTGGGKYDVKAYLRGEIDSQGSFYGWLLRARFYDANGAYVGQTNVDNGYNSSNISTSWQQKGGIATAPNGATSMKVQLYNFMSNGWVNFDDVTVQAVTQITKYYRFGGQTVAMRKGDTLTYLHTGHLGSTVMETNTGGTMTADQKYYAYGKQRDTGSVLTDNQYTGQKLDATGLMYYNARYYDPHIGQFISPDTIVPDPSNVLDYNRYMYVRGNPLRYSDPSGHLSEDELQTLLGDNYAVLSSYWETYDPYWMNILDQLQGGDTLLASELGGIGLQFIGSGSEISVKVWGGSNHSQLHEWQGKGAYTYRRSPLDTEEQIAQRRDQIFNDNDSSFSGIYYPVFDYQVSSGNGSIQPVYLGAGRVVSTLGPYQPKTVLGETLSLMGTEEGTAHIIGTGVGGASLFFKLSYGSTMLAADFALTSIHRQFFQTRSYSDGWGSISTNYNPYISLDRLKQ